MKGRKTRRVDRILRMLLVMSLILGLAFTSMAAPEETASSAEQETLEASLQQSPSYELTMIGDEEVPLAMPKMWEQDPGPAHMITWGLFWLTAVLLGIDIRRHHRRMRELKTLMRVERKKLR